MEKNNRFANYGIILKNYLNKIFVLDRKLGKIRCSIKLSRYNSKLINGAYISYMLEDTIDISNSYKISDIKILNTFNSISNYSYNNLIFFHHVLEISYYFLPLDHNENIDYIFKLILVLYDSNVQDKLFTKLFLYKFFKALNIYPEYKYKDSLRDFTNNFDWKNNLKLNNSLKIWLTLCISCQPYYNRLKTITFLKELDIYE
ncbi:MAG: hypothetical protein M0R03_13450 [Novosphingobium sp.]|nr:hypothetical protein [Novosphingobium sp.]